MVNKIKLLTISLFVLLTGCMGEHATFSEAMRDNFAFTAAERVPDTERKCITLTKPYTLESGSLAFSLPSGRYIAKRKNDTGYFYYAPAKITSSNWFLSPSQEGIYLDNNLNKGNLFGRKDSGYDDRPLRNAVLPNDIFAYIQRNGKC